MFVDEFVQKGTSALKIACENDFISIAVLLIAAGAEVVMCMQHNQ